MTAVWSKWIAPETVHEQVRNTARFLELPASGGADTRRFPLGRGTHGFLEVLRTGPEFDADRLTPEEQLLDYFALCLSAHHATVATFVPTDVDSKIRGLTWLETRDPELLRKMLSLAIEAMKWDQEPVSRRVVQGVSGHNGEQLSVLAGACGRFLDIGDDDGAEQSAAAIEAEVRREESVLESALPPGREEDLLKLAMSLAHNRGDLKQGMSYWRKSARHQEMRRRLEEASTFRLALALYQQTGISAEGHRNYPLRAVRPLRESVDLLLPLAPYLDEWGARVVMSPGAAEALEALVAGCTRIKGQEGYFRAIAGMKCRSSGAFEKAASQISNRARRDMRDARFRKKVDVPRGSFESMMAKRARAVVDGRQERTAQERTAP